MMMPPTTILEMHKFMHDELHGEREVSERGAGVTQDGEHRLRRIARRLFRRPQRELDSYPDSDQIEIAAI